MVARVSCCSLPLSHCHFLEQPTFSKMPRPRVPNRWCPRRPGRSEVGRRSPRRTRASQTAVRACVRDTKRASRSHVLISFTVVTFKPWNLNKRGASALFGDCEGLGLGLTATDCLEAVGVVCERVAQRKPARIVCAGTLETFWFSSKPPSQEWQNPALPGDVSFKGPAFPPRELSRGQNKPSVMVSTRRNTISVCVSDLRAQSSRERRERERVFREKAAIAREIFESRLSNESIFFARVDFEPRFEDLSFPVLPWIWCF